MTAVHYVIMEGRVPLNFSCSISLDARSVDAFAGRGMGDSPSFSSIAHAVCVCVVCLFSDVLFKQAEKKKKSTLTVSDIY